MSPCQQVLTLLYNEYHRGRSEPVPIDITVGQDFYERYLSELLAHDQINLGDLWRDGRHHQTAFRAARLLCSDTPGWDVSFKPRV